MYYHFVFQNVSAKICERVLSFILPHLIFPWGNIYLLRFSVIYTEKLQELLRYVLKWNFILILFSDTYGLVTCHVDFFAKSASKILQMFIWTCKLAYKSRVIYCLNLSAPNLCNVKIQRLIKCITGLQNLCICTR